MQPGRLSDRIVFEVKTLDPITSEETWPEYCTEWAEYEGLSSDSIQTNLDATEITRSFARFTIRYRPDIHAATHRIRFDGHLWNIVEPIHDRKRTMLTIDAAWVDP